MTAPNEKIYYHEYDATNGERTRYDGTVRAVPGGENVNVRHSRRHIRIDDPDRPAGFRNINNVLNVENFAGDTYKTENFWTHHPESQI